MEIVFIFLPSVILIITKYTMSSSDSSESNYVMRSDNEEYSNDLESDSGDIIIRSKRLRVISDSSDDDEVTASTSDDDMIDEWTQFYPWTQFFRMNRILFLKYLVQSMPLLLMRNQLNISINFFQFRSSLQWRQIRIAMPSSFSIPEEH